MDVTKSSVLVWKANNLRIGNYFSRSRLYRAVRRLRRSAAIILHNLSKQNIKPHVTKLENKIICASRRA
jgi:hypothetical protein